MANHSNAEKKTGASLAINIGVSTVELAAGLFTGSLALISDAIHNIGDSMTLLTTYMAMRISKREPDEKYTFGRRRAEVIAAYTNSLIIIFFSALLIWESMKTLANPHRVNPDTVGLMGLVALAGNLASTSLLHGISHTNLNVKSAYIHMVVDTASSAAVVAGAFAIKGTGSYFFDPAVSLGISIYMAFSALQVMKGSIDILMESSPINVSEAKKILESIDGIVNAHHCHAWSIGEGEAYLECHIEIESDSPGKTLDIIEEAHRKLGKAGFTHVTLQPEKKDTCSDKGLIPRKEY